MYSHTLETYITGNHRITIDLPASFPEGDAEIIILSKSGQATQIADETLIDFLDWLKIQVPSGRNKAQIDAQISEERAAWGEA